MHVDGCLYYFAFFAIIFKQKHTKSICATIPQGFGDDDGNEAKAKERWLLPRKRGCWWEVGGVGRLGTGICGVEGANESN